MPQAAAVRATVWQGTACVLLGRLVNLAGQYVTQASISGISYKVVDLKQVPAAVVNAGIFTISSVIFDVLQTDGRWTVDSTGYNVAMLMPGSNFPNAATTYRVQVTFTQTDLNTLNADWDLQTVKVF